jgi:hypothetical protein
MTNSSSFRYLLATETKIQQLFKEHNIEQKMKSWIQSSEIFVDQGEMHHGFCCKIWTVEYSEPQTQLPIATIDRQVYVGGRTVLQVRRLRIDNDVYCLKLPSP